MAAKIPRSRPIKEEGLLPVIIVAAAVTAVAIAWASYNADTQQTAQVVPPQTHEMAR